MDYTRRLCIVFEKSYYNSCCSTTNPGPLLRLLSDMRCGVLCDSQVFDVIALRGHELAHCDSNWEADVLIDAKFVPQHILGCLLWFEIVLHGKKTKLVRFVRAIELLSEYSIPHASAEQYKRGRHGLCYTLLLASPVFLLQHHVACRYWSNINLRFILQELLQDTGGTRWEIPPSHSLPQVDYIQQNQRSSLLCFMALMQRYCLYSHVSYQHNKLLCNIAGTIDDLYACSPSYLFFYRCMRSYSLSSIEHGLQRDVYLSAPSCGSPDDSLLAARANWVAAPGQHSAQHQAIYFSWHNRCLEISYNSGLAMSMESEVSSKTFFSVANSECVFSACQLESVFIPSSLASVIRTDSVSQSSVRLCAHLTKDDHAVATPGLTGSFGLMQGPALPAVSGSAASCDLQLGASLVQEAGDEYTTQLHRPGCGSICYVIPLPLVDVKGVFSAISAAPLLQQLSASGEQNQHSTLPGPWLIVKALPKAGLAYVEMLAQQSAYNQCAPLSSAQCMRYLNDLDVAAGGELLAAISVLVPQATLFADYAALQASTGYFHQTCSSSVALGQAVEYVAMLKNPYDKSQDAAGSGRQSLAIGKNQRYQLPAEHVIWQSSAILWWAGKPASCIPSAQMFKPKAGSKSTAWRGESMVGWVVSGHGHDISLLTGAKISLSAAEHIVQSASGRAVVYAKYHCVLSAEQGIRLFARGDMMLRSHIQQNYYAQTIKVQAPQIKLHTSSSRGYARHSICLHGDATATVDISTQAYNAQAQHIALGKRSCNSLRLQVGASQLTLSPQGLAFDAPLIHIIAGEAALPALPPV